VVTYVTDRQANDIRYAMDCTKISGSLGYQPQRMFEDGLAETVEWYRHHPERWAPLLRNRAVPRPTFNLTTPVGR
jgi:dTDP-glucose 4,6-dehydratase